MNDRELDRGALPRPSVFAASGFTLLAAIGLLVASAFVWYALPAAGAAREALLNAAYYLPFVVLPIAAYMLRRRGLSAAMRLNPLPLLPTLTVMFLGVLCMFAASALDALWAELLNVLGFSAPETSLSMTSQGALMAAIINTAAIPAICEELLFRGFILAAWEGRGTRLAIWVSAALFALLHANVYGLPVYLMIGAISGFIVYALDSLYAGMVFHTVYNASALAVIYLLGDQADAAAEAASSAVSGGLLLTLAGELAFITAIIAGMLATLNVRCAAMGVEPVPRTRVPMRARDWIMLGLALAVMIVMNMVILWGGVS